MQTHSPELYNRISDARPRIMRLGDAKLHLMFQNCVGYWERLDGEFVECRRLKRVTLKYTEIAQILDQALVVLEQHLVLGTLIKM